MNLIHHYSGFGLDIESEIELPELVALPARGAEPDVLIRVRPVPRFRIKATLDEELAVNMVGAAFLIRKGREIIVDVRAGADPAAVRAVLLGKGMAFLLRQRGWLPLHASGASIAGRCVLFVGASGAGKSTTAAAFYRAGHPVIGDDLGAVRIDSDGRCMVQPAWPHVRLLDDARVVLGNRNLDSTPQIDKHRFDLNQVTLQSPCPVAGIFILEYGESICLDRLSSSQAIAELSKYSLVRHRHMDRPSLALHLRDCANIGSLIPVFRLQRPSSLEALPDLVRLVEDAVGLESDRHSDPTTASSADLI